MKFGMVCCPLSDEEVAKNKLKVYPLASEPVLILVNQKNPVNNLTAAQVRGIFSGKISNWKEVGGDDMPIVVVTRLHCKKRPGHWKTILPSHKEFSQERLNVQSAAEMVKRLNDFPGAFGHTGSAWAFSDTDKVKAIRIDGYEATAENLKNGHYPFHRLLSIVFRDDSPEQLLQIGTVAQQLIREHDVTRKYQLLAVEQ
jgi:phosphate transport system substrate-binding protein